MIQTTFIILLVQALQRHLTFLHVHTLKIALLKI